MGDVIAQVNGAEDIIVGLLKDIPDAGTTNFDATLYKFGILYDADDVYQIIVDGQAKATTTLTADGDLVELQLSSGNINYIVKRGATTFNLGSVSYDFTQPPLHVGCSMKANNTSNVTDFIYNYHLGHESLQGPNNPILVKKFDQQVVSNPLLGAGINTKLSLTMPDGILELLGFDVAPEDTTNDEGSFIASVPLQDTTTPLSLSVELPNLGRMENYDGSDGERKNLVALIPKLTQSGNNLVYEASFPLYISINNQYPLNLSSLECRILSSEDNSEVELEHPGCSLLFALHKSSTNVPQDSTK